MDNETLSPVLKTVLSAKRDGGIAYIDCDTVDGGKVTLQFDVRYLWSVAADIRAASIDLLAPVPEALRAALGSDADGDVDVADGETPVKEDAEKEEPKSGFAGLEQAWELCDALNDAQLADPEADPTLTLSRIGAGHFLFDTQPKIAKLPDESGIEIELLNEFKIIYRTVTKDWIPDRKDKAPEQELEVS